MVADAFVANAGVYYYDEPCAILPARSTYHITSKLITPPPNSHFFNLRGERLNEFERYFDALGNAGHRDLGSCSHPQSGIFIDRVAMKILNAPWMLPWFVDNTDAHLITLLRHPAAQALSVMRQNWRYPVEAYADRLDEIGDRFTTAQQETMLRLLAEGSEWERAILDWCVTSLPLRTRAANRVVHAYYEDIVLNQEAFVQDILVGKFGLADRSAMLRAFGAPSNSSRMSTDATRSAIKDGKRDKLIAGWRDKVDADMVATAQAILDTFEVREYSMHAPGVVTG